MSHTYKHIFTKHLKLEAAAAIYLLLFLVQFWLY